MESLSTIHHFANCSILSPPSNKFLHSPTRIPPARRRVHHFRARIATVVAVFRTSSPANELAEDDVLQTFLKERELDGDFVTKVSDMLWSRKPIKYVEVEDDMLADTSLGPAEPLRNEDEDEGGFLKLKRTYEWVEGDISPPANKKFTAKELRNDSEMRRRLNLLRYEALKKEMLLLTVAIGTFCTGYCLLAFSFKAALSYATGVLFSCLYLQLLYQQVDNLTKEKVPQIFMQKKRKTIGIRSQDLKDTFEKWTRGSGFALSSPRLVIPAAIYGIWGLSQHFTRDLIDIQLTPAMVGLFVYKAAALVQVYRDNEKLHLVFPDSEDTWSD